MADRNDRLVIKDTRGGRNNVDPPQYLQDTQVVEAINIDWFNATFARKRNGVQSLTTTSSPFTGQTVSSAYRHVPTTDETAAELWATDDAGTPHIGRLTGGTAWTTPTLKDAPTGNGWDFSYASLNGKLFIAYQSAVDRLHVWDPVSNSVRRAGLAPPAGASTCTNQDLGTYPATFRTYRARYIEERSSIIVRRSEPGPTVTFTPDGVHSFVQVTHPAAISEGETHWELEASSDGVTFYVVDTAAIGSDAFDSILTTDYQAQPLSALIGSFTVQQSYRSIAADQGRLLGFGNYTSTDPQNQVQFSAVIGSTNVGDEERVPLNNFVGLDENDSGPAIGIKGPVGGSFYAFKSRQIHKLTPTSNVTTPYSTLKISPTVGAVSMQSIVVGEDELGEPTLYWTAIHGPHRYGSQGVEYLGKGVEDKTIGVNSGTSLNLAATHVVAHSCWYSERRQVWMWVSTGAHNDPDTVLVFSVGRQAPYLSDYQIGKAIDAWSLFTGGLATARCSWLFSNTVGASMSRDLKPYIGSIASTNTIGKCDTGTQDFSASYQATMTTQAYSPWPDGFTGSVTGLSLTAVTAPGVPIQITSIGDFGAQSRSDVALLDGGGTRTAVRVGSGITVTGVSNVQFTIGDAAPVNNSWQLDDVTMTWRPEGPLVA